MASRWLGCRTQRTALGRSPSMKCVSGGIASAGFASRSSLVSVVPDRGHPTTNVGAARQGALEVVRHGLRGYPSHRVQPARGGRPDCDAIVVRSPRADREPVAHRRAGRRRRPRVARAGELWADAGARPAHGAQRAGSAPRPWAGSSRKACGRASSRGPRSVITHRSTSRHSTRAPMDFDFVASPRGSNRSGCTCPGGARTCSPWTCRRSIRTPPPVRMRSAAGRRGPAPHRTVARPRRLLPRDRATTACRTSTSSTSSRRSRTSASSRDAWWPPPRTGSFASHQRRAGDGSRASGCTSCTARRTSSATTGSTTTRTTPGRRNRHWSRMSTRRSIARCSPLIADPGANVVVVAAQGFQPANSSNAVLDQPRPSGAVRSTGR